MEKYILIGLLILSASVYAQKQDEAILLENTLSVFRNTNFNSDTIYTLHKNEIFLIVENGEIDSNWAQVEITYNKLSKVSMKINQGVCISGYVSKSKINLIDLLPKTQTNEVAFKFILVKADTSMKNSEATLRYGLEIPLSISYEVNEMYLDWKGKLILQDPKFYNDLYNIAFKEGVYSSKENDSFNIYRSDNFFFIKQYCGDGSGSYEITWVIKDGLIIQRLIDEI